jgi:acyl-coenzyme A thioesterase PaaI-like protein
MRPASAGVHYSVRGEVVRLARQVAYAEATVRSDDDGIISRSTGTFLLYRADGADDSSGA